MSELYDMLERYRDSGAYPMHMPGHKRQDRDSILPYSIDITEIEGFDNLNDPGDGVIGRMMDQAAEMYGTVKTWPLVGGSTCGILTAISAACPRGSEVLIARNCHRSVYSACEINDLKTSYIYPREAADHSLYGCVTPDEVSTMMDYYPDCRTVVITSPTYEGVISDVRSIADIVHQRGGILIVDEAHGAHFPFISEMRKYSSLYCGADLVVQSLHKTLKSLTQTAVLHLCTDRVTPARVEHFLHMYQTSSPSYVFMASMAECFEDCKKKQNDGTFDRYQIYMKKYREDFSDLKHMKLLGTDDLGGLAVDPGKLVFFCGSRVINGTELSDILRKEYSIEIEMAGVSHIIAMTSVCDSVEGLSRFSAAVHAVDQNLKSRYKKRNVRKRKLHLAGQEERAESSGVVSLKDKAENQEISSNDSGENKDKPEQSRPDTIREASDNNLHENGTPVPEEVLHFPEMRDVENQRAQQVMTPAKALVQEGMYTDFSRVLYQLENDYVKDSSLPLLRNYHDLISGDYVICYPPGSPVLVPGERISAEDAERIKRALDAGVEVMGLKNGRIRILV